MHPISDCSPVADLIGSRVAHLMFRYEKPFEPVASVTGRAARRLRVSQLVAYYDENPVEVKGKVEIHQSPMSVSTPPEI